MILGSLITIAVEIALVAAGVSWIGEIASRGGIGGAPRPPISSTQEPEKAPTEFNGIGNDTLDNLCPSATLDPEVRKACRERDEWIRAHGGPQ
jgi:hypothetical protein